MRGWGLETEIISPQQIKNGYYSAWLLVPGDGQETGKGAVMQGRMAGLLSNCAESLADLTANFTTG